MYKFPKCKLIPRDKEVHIMDETIYQSLYKMGVTPSEMLDISTMLAESTLNDDKTLLKGNKNEIKNGNYKCRYCNSECSPHMYFLAKLKHIYFKDYFTF